MSYGSGYPGATSSYHGANPGYPGANPGYPGATAAYPGVNPGYPGATAAYPGANPGYPGATAAYPGGGGGAAYPGGAYPGQGQAPLDASFGFIPTGAVGVVQNQAPAPAPQPQYAAPQPQQPQPQYIAPAPSAAPAPVAFTPTPQPKPAVAAPTAAAAAVIAAAAADPAKPFDARAYLIACGYTDDQINAARNEHVDPGPDMCLDDTELRDYGGPAIFAFYKFLKFIAVLIMIFFCLALVNFLIYATQRKPGFGNYPGHSWYNDFFISNYADKQRSAWLGTTILCIIIMFFACPYYYRYIGNFVFEGELLSLAEQERVAEAHGHVDDAIVRFSADGTIDVSARYRTWANIALRRLFSLAVFAGFIVVQVFASIAITKVGDGNKSVAGSFAVAFIAAALNLTYQVFARQLTEVEKHQDQGAADKSLTLKTILFKLANVIAVYGSKNYPANQCVYDVVGEQFLTLLFVEIIFVTPMTLLSSGLLTYFHQAYARVLSSINGDRAHQAQFEMAIEYLSNLYKFYLACMALVVFPMSTVMSIVAFFVEFWGSRYRLVKICGRPQRSTSTMRGTVTAVMMLIFLAVLFTPYAGAIWILAKWAVQKSETGARCGYFP